MPLPPPYTTPGRMITARTPSLVALSTNASCSTRHDTSEIGLTGASSAAGFDVRPSTHTPDVYTMKRLAVDAGPTVRGRFAAAIIASSAARSPRGPLADD